MEEPSSAPVEELPHGFSCPGPLYLPGLLVILAVHVGVLLVATRRAREVGVSWPLVGAAAVTLAVFWLVFLVAARWVGSRVVINLLGLAAFVVFWGGLVAVGVWWLIQVV